MIDDAEFDRQLALGAVQLELQQAAELEAKRAAEKLAEERERERDIPFIETSVSRAVFGLIERCYTFQDNGMLTGHPGVGKTRAFEEAVRRAEAGEGRDVVMIDATGLGTSTMAMFEELFPHLGVYPPKSIAAGVRQIGKEAMFRPLVIIDEAQNMTFKCVREVLEVGRRAKLQLLFSGNWEVLKLVNTERSALEQIGRRIPFRVEVDFLSDDDVDLIASHFNVEGMEGFRRCREVGAAFHADGVVKVLLTARKRLGSGRTIRIDHIDAALDDFIHFRAALDRSASSRSSVARRATAPERSQRSLSTSPVYMRRGGAR